MSISRSEVQEAMALSDELFEVVMGEDGHVAILAFSMALAKYYLGNEEEEREYNNPEEFGIAIAKYVEGCIQTARSAETGEYVSQDRKPRH